MIITELLCIQPDVLQCSCKGSFERELTFWYNLDILFGAQFCIVCKWKSSSCSKVFLLLQLNWLLRVRCNKRTQKSKPCILPNRESKFCSYNKQRLFARNGTRNHSTNYRKHNAQSCRPCAGQVCVMSTVHKLCIQCAWVKNLYGRLTLKR